MTKLFGTPYGRTILSFTLLVLTILLVVLQRLGISNEVLQVFVRIFNVILFLLVVLNIGILIAIIVEKFDRVGSLLKKPDAKRDRLIYVFVCLLLSVFNYVVLLGIQLNLDGGWFS